MLGSQTSFAVEPHCANTYSISEVDGGKGEPLGTTTLRLDGGAAGSITSALWVGADRVTDLCAGADRAADLCAGAG
jgi:hypothetical protein